MDVLLDFSFNLPPRLDFMPDFLSGSSWLSKELILTGEAVKPVKCILSKKRFVAIHHWVHLCPSYLLGPDGGYRYLMVKGKRATCKCQRLLCKLIQVIKVSPQAGPQETESSELFSGKVNVPRYLVSKGRNLQHLPKLNLYTCGLFPQNYIKQKCIRMTLHESQFMFKRLKSLTACPEDSPCINLSKPQESSNLGH